MVDSFVWPTTGADRGHRYSTERGYRTAHWVGAGMTHWVISDAYRQLFVTVIGAIEALLIRAAENSVIGTYR